VNHKKRVMRLLKDGKPHSHLEGYELGVMLHSRVADLRRDGYAIRCWREGDLYLYQLEGSQGPTDPQAKGAASSALLLPDERPAPLIDVASPETGPVGPFPHSVPQTERPARQLSMWEPA